MAAPVSTGMEKAEMRKMFMHTKEKPVHCAIGVGKDQALGLLVMDKMKAPKMLEKQLIDAMPDAKNTRWGTAAVDWDGDAKLVKFYLNKPVSSMARRLVKTIKGTGFTKVQIMMEDGTLVEGAADEEEEAAGAPGNGAAPEAAATAPAAAAAPPPPPPPPPAQAEAPAQDAAELTRRLAALAPRIPQAAGEDATRKAELLKLASLGNVNIKTNNLTYAATYIGQLERALAAPPPPPPAPPPPAPTAAPAQDAAALGKLLATLIPRVAQVADAGQKAELAKLANLCNVNLKTNNLTYAATYITQLRTALDRGAGAPGTAAPAPPKAEATRPDATGPEAGAYDKQGKLWADARQAVEADLGRLRAAILDAYKGQPFAGEIEAKFQERTAPVLGTLDLRLTDLLGEVANTTDAAKRSQLIDQAHAVIDGYRTYAADPLLADLDANPFVPLSVKATLTAALDGVASELH